MAGGVGERRSARGFLAALGFVGRRSYEIYLTHMFVVFSTVAAFKAMNADLAFVGAWYAAAVAITERHDGVVPSSLTELRALPGIGDYTAAAVAAFAYGETVAVLDTNVRRVLARADGGRELPADHLTVGERARATELLPDDEALAPVWSVAVMELGALVCRAGSPRCVDCPVADLCAWRAAGYPDTGDERRKQAKYEGSDRQARGAVLKTLRDAASHAVPLLEVVPDWPDPQQRDRAIDSLIADGLAEASDGLLRLPA